MASRETAAIATGEGRSSKYERAEDAGWRGKSWRERSKVDVERQIALPGSGSHTSTSCERLLRAPEKNSSRDAAVPMDDDKRKV